MFKFLSILAFAAVIGYIASSAADLGTRSIKMHNQSVQEV